MLKNSLVVFIILFCAYSLASVRAAPPEEDYGQYITPPEYFGMVRMNNFTKQGDMPPVIFDHWLHRATFTCRICHIDIGFAMKAKATKVTANDNIQGYFCGSCHNGTLKIDGQKVFSACAVKYSEKEAKRCGRCHSDGNTEQRKYKFETFTQKLPRLQYNQIDWEKAEEKRLIKSIDSIEGIFYKTDAIKAQDNFSIEVNTKRKTDVIFSHKKHVVWNGCAVCHPMIFPSSAKGSVQYSMFQIMDGEYCGVCHVSVAFSVWLCYKCHKDA